MLGKLFKHEWQDSWLIMTILNGSVLLLSIIGSRSVQRYFEILDDMDMGGFIYSIYILLYVFGVIALTLAATFYFYVRFYKNMYTDQGYLMHTLPVNHNELIISKLLVALIWRVISFLVIFVGVFKVSFEIDDILEIIDNIDLVVSDVVLMIILLLGSALYSILVGYVSISIGQFSSKNKVLASIGAYFGIKVVARILRSFLTFINIFTFKEMIEKFNDFDDPSTRASFMLIFIVIIYIACALYYFITQWIMKNRLNLE